MSDDSMISVEECVKRYEATLRLRDHTLPGTAFQAGKTDPPVESGVDRAEREAKRPIRVEDGDFYDGEAMGVGYLTETLTQDEIAREARNRAEAKLKRRVERPSHYIEGRKYEPWDVIEDWGLGFLLGNVVKYVARAGRKENEFEDLHKARVYLTKAIDNLIEEEERA